MCRQKDKLLLIPSTFLGFLAVILLVSVWGDITMGMPIPTKVKEVVAFIYVDGPDGQPIPNGTGFFVGVKVVPDEEKFAVYLVTARHVLMDEQKKHYLDKVYVRLNRKQGDAQLIMLPLVREGASKNLFTQNDTSVDLAVLPFVPNQEIFVFKFLPDNMITTQAEFKEMGIAEGSEVFFTGLFTPHIGTTKNYPVVRFGRVALISEEKIDWKGIPTDLYLIEGSSFGGNSGSPVFFYLGAERKPGMLVVGKSVMKLAGVMKGAFQDVRPIQIVETTPVPVATSNLGIAAVVPAYKLHELLFGEELAARRRNVE